MKYVQIMMRIAAVYAKIANGVSPAEAAELYDELKQLYADAAELLRGGQVSAVDFAEGHRLNQATWKRASEPPPPEPIAEPEPGTGDP